MFYRFSLDDRVVVIESETAGKANVLMNEHYSQSSKWTPVKPSAGTNSPEIGNAEEFTIYYESGKVVIQ